MLQAVLALVTVLAGANWMLAPDDGLRWLRGAIILLALWGGQAVWRRALTRHGRTDADAVEAYVDRAITLVVVPLGIYMIVGYSLQLWVALGGVMDPDVRRRLLGVLASGVMLVLGNNLPKILTPLSMLPHGGAVRIQTARRYLGAALVILALFMAGAFLFGSLEWAIQVRRWSAITCVLAVLVAVVWMNLGLSDSVKDHEQGI